MRSRIIVAFPKIMDARLALGLIKKTDLSADLTVLYAPNAGRQKSNNFEPDYEFGAELLPLETQTDPTPVWSGLNEETLGTLGKVKVGSNQSFHPMKNGIRTPIQYGLTASDLHLIQGELRQNKVIGVIEITPESFSKVRLILESNGAEILEHQAKA